jgi:hypothetical protein
MPDELSNRPSRGSGAAAVLVGIAIVAILMLLSIVRFPESLSESGWSNLLVTAAALVAYGGVAAWARRQTAARTQTALSRGAQVGGFLAVVSLINLGVEHFVYLGAASDATRGVSMWAVLFLSFGFAGSSVDTKVGSLILGIVSSIWAAVVNSVAILIGGFSLALLFMPHMKQILFDAFSHSNMKDPGAFVVHNTMGAAASHALLLPVLAAIFGCGGAVAGKLLRPVQRRGGIALCIGAVVILALALAAIRHASSLDRAQRPPYIMAGLLGLGVTLMCAYPIVVAVRRPARSA